MATTDRYDRQLRLWGPTGQRKLMHAHILLIKADSVGTETLKNLVLPGIGAFTILDDFIVSSNDLGCNFFVTKDSIGKPRAEVITTLLSELNPDVCGTAKVQNFQNILNTEPAFFSKFTLIITANLPVKDLLQLSAALEQSSKQVPIIALRSYGLLGSVRIQLQHHFVLDLKQESDNYDLRVSHPFPSLEAYFNSIDLNALTDMDHAHVPYPVILYKALQKYKEENNGKSPADTKSFQAVVRSLARRIHHEENFNEAVKKAYRAYKRSDVSSEMQVLIEQVESDPIHSSDSPYNFMVRALGEFLRRHEGYLPVSPSVPDMTATSDFFLRLQEIYVQKANEDLAAFKQILHELLQSVGLPETFLDQEEVEMFCRNAATVQCVSTTSISDEIEGCSEQLQETITSTFFDLFSDPKQTPLIWYLTLRAADQFQSQKFRYPGSFTNQVEDETAMLEKDAHDVFEILQQLCTGKCAVPSEYLESPNSGSDNAEAVITLDHAREVTRYGGVELHNISSMMGGIAAQEAVKMITNIYSPLNNTYFFNGIQSVGATYTF